jgi:hypothetical protein
MLFQGFEVLRVAAILLDGTAIGLSGESFAESTPGFDPTQDERRSWPCPE